MCKLILIIIFVLLFLTSDICLAVAPVQLLPALPAVLSDPWFWILYPVLTFVLRILSDLFLKASEKTKNKWDNVVAKYFANFVEVLAKIFGSFGFGKSKMLK